MNPSPAPRRKRSIEVAGVTHGAAPIPMGARVGNMLFSSGLMGKDPATDRLPPDGPSQARFLFANLRTLLANGGATLEDVVHVTAFVKDNGQREALNAEWVRCFPDPHDRPARHTQVADLQGGMLMQLEIVAVVAGALMDDPVERLSRLDVCALSDALDKLGLDGFVSGLAQQAGARRIAGRVVTFRLVPKDHGPVASGPPRHLGTTAVEAARRGDIIVVEQRTGIDAGSWGGILSLGAKVRGVAGVIADGPVRDIDEARGYDFPVFCRGLTARTARGRIVEAETNGTVRIGDVPVRPGDFAVADASGVVFIAERDIGRVLDAAETIVGREAAMAKALLAGTPIGQVMNADYEHMLQ